MSAVSRPKTVRICPSDPEDQAETSSSSLLKNPAVSGKPARASEPITKVQ